MRESMEKVLDYFKKYPSLPLFCGFGVAYLTYYLFHVAKKPLVACGDKKLKAFLMTHCPILHEKFWPTLWCFESRGQTILRSLMKSNPVINYVSELVKTPDGGMIKLDWVENDNSETYQDKNTRPTVIVLPGLTGSSQESYALHMADEARKKGYRVVVFNNRGMGGTKLLTARTYCAANTEDMATVVDHVNRKYPKAPLIGVGVSLGGMILVNYIGKRGKDCKLHAALTFSTAFCPFASTVSLETTVNRYIFNHHLTTNLLRYVDEMILFNYVVSAGIKCKLKAAMVACTAFNIFETAKSMAKIVNWFLLDRYLTSHLRGYADEMILFNYVAHAGLECKLKAGMIASAPFDTFEATKSMEKPVNWFLLNRYLTYYLCKTAIKMILFNYVAHAGLECKLNAAMVACTAFNIFESTKSLEKPTNWFLLNRYLTNYLCQTAIEYTSLFHNHVDMEKVAQSKTIYEFDEHFTSKIFGYENAEEYYHDANLHYKVDKIEIPLLCLNAADDPFSPLHAIPIKEAEKNENVALVVTSHGGHIGFLEGLFPRHTSYMDRMYGQFIDAIFKHGGELERSKE